MIIKAKVLTCSHDDPYRRVKLQSPETWSTESPLIESVNGLYLRVGEMVFVDVTNEMSPLIIGRCCNWLDAQELTDLLNNIINMINQTNATVTKNAQTFNTHTHPKTAVTLQRQDTIGSNDAITIDNVIHKH